MKTFQIAEGESDPHIVIVQPSDICVTTLEPRFQSKQYAPPPTEVDESLSISDFFIKWQNNPKYGNLSTKFHIYPTASLFTSFLLITSLRNMRDLWLNSEQS